MTDLNGDASQNLSVAQNRWIVWAVAATLTTLALVYLLRHPNTDTLAYWRAARRAWAGQPLYPASDGLRVYRYSPGLALFLGFIAPLSLTAARAVWYLLMIATTVFLVRRAQRTDAPLVVLAGIVLILRPLVDEFHYGQANLFVLLLLVLAFAAEDRGRDGLAGCAVAFAVAMKLSPALFVLDFVFRRRWRALAGVAATATILLLLPLLTYGPAGAGAVHLEWLNSLRTSAVGLTAGSANQSLLGFVLRAGLSPWVAGLGGATLVSIALLTAWREPRRSLLLLTCVLYSPLGWASNYVLAFPAAVLAARQSRLSMWLVMLLGVLLIIPMYDIGGAAMEHWVFDHSLPMAAMLALFFWVACAYRNETRAA